ncbi:MAG: ABC transporter permease [Comamonadaceae bacterium BICA1-1]|nr:MAG: ABC transporter permease [Comamonadaceae bacterium BICA1-1]
MRLRKLALSAALALAAAATALTTSLAMAQAPVVQFFPSLTGRTGAVAPNAAPFANGFADYMKLVNARGGINGVQTLVEECETAYATDRGVECYERLKGRHGGATVFQPLSTGITFALMPRLAVDRIPMITSGYGRSDTADGAIFPWVFPLLGHYWIAGDVVLQHIANQSGGWANLRGKTIAYVFHDSPAGRELLPLINRRAEMHGFTVLALPVPPPGVEQRATWMQIRRGQPDFLILLTLGAMTTTAIRQAIATGFPLDRVFGSHWSGAEPDLRDIGADARGFSAVMMQHGQGRDSEVVRQILAQVHDRGQGAGPRTGVGEVYYMRGVVAAMLSVEGVLRAQERFGRGRHVTGEQARWGIENLNITQARLNELGFAGVLRGPIVTSCRNHVGTALMRIHTWNGSGFDWSSDWLQADMNLITRMVTASAESFARDNNITRRTEPGC